LVITAPGQNSPKQHVFFTDRRCLRLWVGSACHLPSRQFPCLAYSTRRWRQHDVQYNRLTFIGLYSIISQDSSWWPPLWEPQMLLYYHTTQWIVCFGLIPIWSLRPLYVLIPQVLRLESQAVSRGMWFCEIQTQWCTFLKLFLPVFVKSSFVHLSLVSPVRHDTSCCDIHMDIPKVSCHYRVKLSCRNLYRPSPLLDPSCFRIHRLLWEWGCQWLMTSIIVRKLIDSVLLPVSYAGGNSNITNSIILP
jgi:hypothetical protein